MRSRDRGSPKGLGDQGKNFAACPTFTIGGHRGRARQSTQEDRYESVCRSKSFGNSPSQLPRSLWGSGGIQQLLGMRIDGRRPVRPPQGLVIFDVDYWDEVSNNISLTGMKAITMANYRTWAGVIGVMKAAERCSGGHYTQTVALGMANFVVVEGRR